MAVITASVDTTQTWPVELVRVNRRGNTVKRTVLSFPTRALARTTAAKFRGDARTVSVKVG